MTSNLVSASLAQEDIDAVRAAAAEIRARMPFLIDLSKDQLSRMPRVAEANIRFAQLMTEVAERQPDLIPPAIDIAELRRDVDLYHQLRLIQMDLAPLLELINDTQAAAGADAYRNALALYGIANALGNLEGMDEARRLMSSRFSSQGNRTPGEAPTEEPDLAGTEPA